MITAMLISNIALSPVAAGAQDALMGDARILYVMPEADGDCNSWEAACDLQIALNDAQAGDEIWVAAGVYYPGSVSDSPTVSFHLKSGVALYGGFMGTETVQTQRSWSENPTILSGDIDRNDLTDTGVVTDTLQIIGTNAYHVVTGSGADSEAVLDGFIITAGSAKPEIYPDDTAAEISSINDLTFVNNVNSGGGLINSNGSPTLMNLIITGNQALAGGGMANGNNSSPILTNVTISANSAVYGGGMVNLESSPTLTNVLFTGNSAGEIGGGILDLSISASSLINTTFYANKARSGGGIASAELSNTTLTNAIVWGNAAVIDPQIHVSENSTISVAYSLIQGGIYPGWGNLNADPLFVDAAAGNLRLQSASPAIDAGNNFAVPAGVLTDLEGNPRFVDYRGSGATVDMGAYEARLFRLYLPLSVR
jgi:predicted outer membrane repeat protein